MKQLWYRKTWLVLGAAVLLLAAGCSRPEPASAPVAGNLIVISIDTLRADHLGAYGYPRATSPRLDALAAGGAVFTNTISPSGWTVPAHMTLFTGLDPVAHRLIDFPRPGRLGEGYRTLAAVLKAQGFHTAAFTGGGFISEQHGFEIGFDRFVTRGRHFEHSAREFRDWFEALPADERFFVFYHGFNTHRPYRPPEGFGDRFLADDAKGSGEEVADRLFPLLEDLAVLHRHHEGDREAITRRPSDDELELVVSQYDAEIAAVDVLLGTLLDSLKNTGRLDDTLVVIVSDHGDEFYEHASLDHVHSLYDELLQVPWLMFGPGVPAVTVDEQVGLIDVMPTVLELLGVEPTAPMQGKSRVALIRGGPSGDEAVFSFNRYSDYPYRLASVRTPGWKFIRWQLAGMRGKPLSSQDHYTVQFRSETEDFVELFDLTTDPGEKQNVAATHPEVVRAFENLLVERERSSLRLAQTPGQSPELTEEYLEALKSLGYVQ